MLNLKSTRSHELLSKTTFEMGEQAWEMKNTGDVHAQDLRRMIANVAHDLKTPLAAFVNGNDLCVSILSDLENKLINSPDLRPILSDVLAVKSILSNVAKISVFMKMTINRCIDYTKHAHGIKLIANNETVNLVEAVELPLSCVRELGSRVQIVLDPIPREISQYIITDKQWLQENIICLASNAVKYSSKGTVTISISLIMCANTGKVLSGKQVDYSDASKASPINALHSSNSGGIADSATTTATAVSQQQQQLPYILVECEDTGIGLSEAAMASLFEPFKQAQRLAGGTGLGLFSLANRIHAIQGACGVRKRKDGAAGCLFWFTIPYKPDHSGSTSSDEEITSAAVAVTVAAATGRNKDSSGNSSYIYEASMAANKIENTTPRRRIAAAAAAAGAATPRSRFKGVTNTIPAIVSSNGAIDNINNHNRTSCVPPTPRHNSSNTRSIPRVNNNNSGSTSRNTTPGSSPLLAERPLLLPTNSYPISSPSSPTITTTTTIKCTQSASLQSIAFIDSNVISSDSLAVSGGVDETTATTLVATVSEVVVHNECSTSKNKDDMIKIDDITNISTTTNIITNNSSRNNSSDNSISSSMTTLTKSSLSSPLSSNAISPFYFMQPLIIQEAHNDCSNNNTDEPQPLQKLYSDTTYCEDGGNEDDNADCCLACACGSNNTEQLLDENDSRNTIVDNDGDYEESDYEDDYNNHDGLVTSASVGLTTTTSTNPTNCTDEEEAPVAGSYHVLLVDDSVSILKLCTHMLRRLGHRVDTAENGFEALNKMADRKYDVVLMDLQMPVLDGLETVLRLRQKEKEEEEEEKDKEEEIKKALLMTTTMKMTHCDEEKQQQASKGTVATSQASNYQDHSEGSNIGSSNGDTAVHSNNNWTNLPSLSDSFPHLNVKVNTTLDDDDEALLSKYQFTNNNSNNTVTTTTMSTSPSSSFIATTVTGAVGALYGSSSSYNPSPTSITATIDVASIPSPSSSSSTSSSSSLWMLPTTSSLLSYLPTPLRLSAPSTPTATVSTTTTATRDPCIGIACQDDCSSPSVDGIVTTTTPLLSIAVSPRPTVLTTTPSPLLLAALSSNRAQQHPNTTEISIPGASSTGAAAALSSTGTISVRRQLVIGLSANSDEETTDLAISSGFDGFIAKPLTYKSLEDIFNKINCTLAAPSTSIVGNR